mmetsp:Transcript_226/g.360  ORF Transcript_226/g.360 Transcript_226/m.360 type:complete len:479 (-) Transcript_226:1591-3027(-)
MGQDKMVYSFHTLVILVLSFFTSSYLLWYHLQSKSDFFGGSTSNIFHKWNSPLSASVQEQEIHNNSPYSFSHNVSHHDAISNIKSHNMIGNDGSNDQSLTCQRYCPTRINKIYYDGDPAGLGDRIIILKGLAQLAGYLCAEVIMPPPKEQLTTIHNNGRPISEELEWSDFINITFIQDGSPAIKSAKTLEDGITISSWSDIPAITFSGSKDKDWLHVVSTDGKIRDDFQYLLKFSFQQPHNATIGFVWEIHKEWYTADLWSEQFPRLVDLEPERENADHDYYDTKMRPFFSSYYRVHKNLKEKEKSACWYIKSDSPPTQMAMLQKRVLRRIEKYSLKNAIFGTLHLRRGDVIDVCDTSVETMRQYFSCSLKNTETLGRNITLLLTSDEVDKQYRHDIMDLMKDYPHVSILDVDKIVTHVVREAADHGIISKALVNNYYTYEVENILRDKDSTFVRFHLMRRRNRCRNCVKLVNELKGM